jgi:radical SAM superfamily enzyme YgiQ (UPF0313 family)
VEWVIEDLNRIKDLRKPTFFTDDNFTANPRRTTKLLESIIANGLNQNGAAIQTPVELADNPNLMALLQRARVNSLCIGIESLNDDTLKAYGKPYTAEQNKESIKALRSAGFWIHGMMVLGGDGDTPETLRETSEWANHSLDSVQFSTLIPLPGSRFFDQMREEGRVLTTDWSLYDGQHVVTRPKHFTPYGLQETGNAMTSDFYSVRNSLGRVITSSDKVFALKLFAYTSILGGIKKTLSDPQSKRHLEFLKSVS